MKLNEQLLRKFIREIIVERKGDSEFRADAEKVRQQLMAAFTSVPASNWKRFNHGGELPGLAVKLSDCGINMPPPLENMSVGYIIDEEGASMGADFATTYSPVKATKGSGRGVSPDFPDGIIIFRVMIDEDPETGFITMFTGENSLPKNVDKKMFPPVPGSAHAISNIRIDNDFAAEDVDEFTRKLISKKNAGKYLSKIIDTFKTVFIHEMRHMYSFIPRDGKTGESEQMEKFLDSWKGDKESYFKSNHEANAYLIQAFEDMIRDFERFYSRSELSSVEKQPNKRGAKVYAPNATEVWNKFYANLDQGFRYNLRNETDRIMKKFAARVLDMWDEYYESLPD